MRRTDFPELAKERVREEWFKWAEKSEVPSFGLRFLAETEWIEHFPELNAIRGVQHSVGFGSQIRSYVMQPYQMIKDVRTGYEVGDIQRVLDGELDGFVEAFLGAQAKKSADDDAK